MAKSENGFEAELKEVRFEIHTLDNRREGLVQSLERATSPEESSRLKEQIGKCDVALMVARQRADYLEKREREDDEALGLAPPLKRKLRR
ncbi:hypothetical protein PMN64_12495 [Bradyrhizobium sp. UFLA01-814]|uniref:hypothetical protein n=1 Tax=Bradyrhizobium sp. UFLA01-814 TaxID=3023480 RepID=UPI00398ADC03